MANESVSKRRRRSSEMRILFIPSSSLFTAVLNVPREEIKFHLDAAATNPRRYATTF